MAANNFSLSQDLLHELFEYRDGLLLWKRGRGGMKVGDEAGYLTDNGYKVVSINKKDYRVHRVIFMLFNGSLQGDIDHIDGNRLNNKIENLRQATRSQNLYNTRISNRNTSGVKGVSWDKARNKWDVRIRVKKAQITLGRFESIEEAKAVISKFRQEHHGEFANHG